MTFRPPPRPATWLLEQFGGHSRLDPLIGDLAEQFAGGRTQLWYWRQAVGAIGMKIVASLQTHGFSFITAVLAGLALTQAWRLGSSHLFQPLYTNGPRVNGHAWTNMPALRMVGLQLNAFSNGVLTFATAWLVIRIHRAHQRAALMVFALLIVAPRLSGIARLLFDATSHAHFTYALVPLIVPTGLQAAYTVAEGLWAIRVDRFRELGRWTRTVTVLTVVQAVLVAIVYDARIVGTLPLERPEWIVIDAFDIGCWVYLAYLLWHPQLADPATQMRDGSK